MVSTAVVPKAQETTVNIVDTLSVNLMFELFFYHVNQKINKKTLQLLCNLHLMNWNKCVDE